MDINFYKEKMTEYRGQRNQLNKLIEAETVQNDMYEKDRIDAELASDIIYHVAKQTQENLSYNLETFVTNGIKSVVPDSFDFRLDWDIKNNRTQCEISLVSKEGAKLSPRQDAEGTINDVVSVVLRIAVWTLGGINKTSPVFILDEPSRFVSAKYRANFSEMLKSLCDKLGIQIITVTHTEEIMESADKIFPIIKKDGISNINRGIVNT